MADLLHDFTVLRLQGDGKGVGAVGRYDYKGEVLSEKPGNRNRYFRALLFCPCAGIGF
jgi:hypothetical protein